MNGMRDHSYEILTILMLDRPYMNTRELAEALGLSWNYDRVYGRVVQCAKKGWVESLDGNWRITPAGRIAATAHRKTMAPA